MPNDKISAPADRFRLAFDPGPGLFSITTPRTGVALARTLRISFLAVVAPAILTLACPSPAAPPDIPILVDGVPLDARAVSVQGEAYIPAWILENFGKTKVTWSRPANVLEIVTIAKPDDPQPADGVLIVKVGGRAETEGTSVGKTVRLFLLNVDPKDFRFPDGRTASERARDGSLDRVGPASPAAREYLGLSPAGRSAPEGWGMVARMNKEEITRLPALVELYEALYRSLYYDLLTNLVMEMEERVREEGALDPSLRGITIRPLPLGAEGEARLKVAPGIRFLYGRMLQGANQVVWDVPVSVRNRGETVVELSLRNAAIRQ